MDESHYPLGDHARTEVRAQSGKLLSQLTLAEARSGELSPDDLRIHPDTLREQARIAAEAGWGQLAANLRRAAELAIMPNERVLTIYEALRPYRVPQTRLFELADEVETQYGAIETAALIREAAAAYRKSGLL